jgi:signal transduction histidine kinase
VPRLIVTKGIDEGKQFELSGPAVSVGRHASNAIYLHDTEVSRRHAEFRLSDGGYRLIDLGSANGTLVNTKRITDAILQPGDHVQLGQTILVYTASRPENAPPASDLADRIRMVRQEAGFSSAIIKTIGETEGSRILQRPESASTPFLRTGLANLAIMYETIQAVSHILDVDQLLDRIMELVFKSIEADRGCVMVRDPDAGTFEPKAVRFRDREAPDEIVISRTIMEHVLREKQGVLVSDAAQDTRFKSGASIVRFGIREAICVPMKGRHETLGVLYLDTQSTAKDIVEARRETGKFGEDHLALAIAIAHMAALSVEETRYHQSLLQAERLAAVGQTIATVSHHIKNILQNITSGGDLLKMGIAEMDKELLEKGFAITDKNLRKVNDLVLDMLSFSKEREPAIEMIDLNRVTEDVVELVRGRASTQGVKLATQLADDLPPVPADPEGVHRALLNIVSNALDALEGRDNPQVLVGTRLEDDGEWVQIVVRDNGPGIEPHKLGEIFKPFVSTKGARGTGLGLPVSRKIFREHGGDITVKSQPGKGTRFTLRLPMKSPVADAQLNQTMTDMPVPPPEAD